jgi:hypothetical protein
VAGVMGGLFNFWIGLLPFTPLQLVCVCILYIIVILAWAFGVGLIVFAVMNQVEPVRAW